MNIIWDYIKGRKRLKRSEMGVIAQLEHDMDILIIVRNVSVCSLVALAAYLVL